MLNTAESSDEKTRAEEGLQQASHRLQTTLSNFNTPVLPLPPITITDNEQALPQEARDENEIETTHQTQARDPGPVPDFRLDLGVHSIRTSCLL